LQDFKTFCALLERTSRLRSAALDFAQIQQPRDFVLNENVIQCFEDKVVNINHVNPRKPNEFTLHAILVSHSWGKQEKRAVWKRNVFDQTFL